MKREVIAEGINQDGDKYVLCYVRKGKLSVEFVTWVVGKRSNYCLGHYFSSLEGGVKDLKQRVDLANGGEIDWKIPANSLWNEAQVTLFFELKKDNSNLEGGEGND